MLNPGKASLLVLTASAVSSNESLTNFGYPSTNVQI